MHLGVNVIRLSRRFTGVGRYIECVLKEWAEMEMPFDRISLYTHTPLDPDRVAFPLERYDVQVIGRRVPDPLWEATALRSRATELDVLFAPSYTIPYRYPGRVVVTNLGPPENVVGTYQWWRSKAYDALYRHSARRADRVLACSESVKKRLVDIYGLPAGRVDVTYLAASDLFRPVVEEAQLSGARATCGVAQGEPFIVFVGKLARRHQVPWLLEAFAKVKREEGLPHRLVLIGPDYLGLDVPARAARLGVGDAVTHVPYVVHQELPAVYSAAEFSVFPCTDAEGFGIPVVESMACGTPVVTTNRGSVREVGPGAALMIETNEVAELAAALSRMASDASLRGDLVPKGLARSKEFTWAHTARKTRDVLLDVVEGRPKGAGSGAGPGREPSLGRSP